MEQNNIVSLYTNKNRDQSALDNLSSFIGFNQNIYLDPAVTGYGFVFVTKPPLFIYPMKPAADDYKKDLAYKNMCKDPYFTMFITGESGNKMDSIIAKQLSYEQFSDAPSLFLPIFTNAAKQLSTSDITVDSVNMFGTREGYSVPMPTTKTMSETAGTVSINVSETSNLDFEKMLGLWINYISNITNGTFSANPDMIKNDMLDYTCSIYYFLLGPDGRTLKYWCRYTSCFPVTVPYSALSYQKGVIDKADFDVNFQYTLKEDMNPRILEDFNMVSLKMVTSTFTQTNYDQFLTDTAESDNLGYSSYSSSGLLSKEKLMNGTSSSLIAGADRDPIIYFEPESTNSVFSDSRPGHYVLSLGDNSLANKVVNSILGSTDYSYADLRDSL
jgi:hypothetical protein